MCITCTYFICLIHKQHKSCLFLSFILSFSLDMTKTTIMKRIVALFRKTHEKKQSPVYPLDLTSTYKVSKKTLGIGSFAVVKKCVHRSTGQPYALKIILKKAIAGKYPSHFIFFLLLNEIL